MSNIKKYKELKANLLEHKRFGVKPEQSLIEEFNKLSKETLKERTEKKIIKEEYSSSFIDGYKKIDHSLSEMRLGWIKLSSTEEFKNNKDHKIKEAYNLYKKFSDAWSEIK